MRICSADRSRASTASALRIAESPAARPANPASLQAQFGPAERADPPGPDPAGGQTPLAVEPLFAGADMHSQKARLLATLVLLRRSLRDVGAIVPALRELGRRHVAYGARADHYSVVAAVLIASMAEVAGERWHPEYERAWSAALEVVAGAMLEGAAAAA